MATIANKKTAVQTQALNKLLNSYFKVFKIAVWLLVVIGGYIFLISPRLSSLKLDNQNLVISKVKELRDLGQYGDGLKKLSAAVKEAQKNQAATLTKLEEILPSAAATPSLMAQLEAISLTSGFRLTGLNISEGQPKSTKKKASPEEANGAEGAPVPETAGAPAAEAEQLPKEIKPVNVMMTVSGGNYLSLKRLLSNLEQHLRLMDVSSINFSGAGAEGVYNIALKAYYYDAGKAESD